MTTEASGSEVSFATVLAAFAEAEAALKIEEHLDQRILFPSINELRYAGHHLCRAVTQNEAGHADRVQSELGSAYRHCKRAAFDAREASLLYHLEVIAEFRADYAQTVVSDIVPEYSELCEQVEDATMFIETVLPEAHKNREQHYSECADHYKRIAMVARRFESAREELNKKLERQRGAARRQLVSIGIGVAGLLIGIAGVVTTIITLVRS